MATLKLMCLELKTFPISTFFAFFLDLYSGHWNLMEQLKVIFLSGTEDEEEQEKSTLNVLVIPIRQSVQNPPVSILQPPEPCLMHFNGTPQSVLFTWKSFSWNRLSQSHYWCQFEILFFLKLVGVYVFLNTPVFGQDLDMTRRRSYWLVRARNLCWYFHTLTDLAPNTLPAASIMIFARSCKFAVHTHF